MPVLKTVDLGKRTDQRLVMASAAGQKSRLLYLGDRNASHLFVVDTGADVNVFPASSRDRRGGRRGDSLVAANGSSILADIAQPIHGADFFRNHHRAIDVHCEWRPCCNNRHLNDVIVADLYPLPHIPDFTAGRTVFSKIDLVKGSHQTTRTPNFSFSN